MNDGSTQRFMCFRDRVVFADAEELMRHIRRYHNPDPAVPDLPDRPWPDEDEVDDGP